MFIFRFFVILVVAVELVGCSLAPVTPRVKAEPNGKGNYFITGNFSPAFGANYSYGITDKVDIGADFEQLGNIAGWLRYNLNHTESQAFSINTGLFNYPGDAKARGYFLGATSTMKINDRFSWFADYRYSDVTYEFTDNLLLNFNLSNTSDFSKVSEINVGFNWQVIPKASLSLGVSCQHLHLYEDPEYSSTACLPLIGLQAGPGSLKKR